MPAASRPKIEAQEARLRDALLGALLIEANTGGFDGNFTRKPGLRRLRESLLAAGRRAGGTDVQRILIEDIGRQETIASGRAGAKSIWARDQHWRPPCIRPSPSPWQAITMRVRIRAQLDSIAQQRRTGDWSCRMTARRMRPGRSSRNLPVIVRRVRSN